MKIQSNLRQSSVITKDDTSPVTVADFAAQAIVAWALRRGNIAERLSMVAEETADDLRAPGGEAILEAVTSIVQDVVGGSHPGTTIRPDEVLELIDLGDSRGGPAGRHWVLDPIDGTRGFVGMRQYSVCLGLIEDGTVTLGVLGCPNLPLGCFTAAAGEASEIAGTSQEGVGVVFAAVRGQGACCGPLMDGLPTQTVRVREASRPEDVVFMESYDSRHSDHSVSARIAEALGITAERLRTDSQVKYGLLARGDAQLFLRFPSADYREKIWDHCAGSVIVSEAGGILSDSAGNPLDFSKGRWLAQDGGIVAATPEVHARLLEVLKSGKFKASKF